MKGPVAAVGANRMPPPRRRRRRGLTLLLSVLVLLALLWSGYWFAAYTVVSTFVAQSEAAPARAAALACEAPAYGGFPLSLAMDCGTLTAGGPGFGARIDGLSASAPLYNPGRIDAEAAGPLRIESADFGIGILAAWEHATASARADLSGLVRAASTATGLRVALSGPGAPVAGFAIGDWQGTLDQTAGETPGMILAFSSDDFRLAEGFGITLPPIDSAGRLTLVGAGPIAAPDLGVEISRWIARGGRIEVETLSFASGTVRLAVSGPLSLSRDGLLSGTLALQVFGTDGLAELIATILPRFRNEAANLASAVIALTQPVQTPSGPAQETRLTLRDGAVSVGFVPLFTLPPFLAQR